MKIISGFVFASIFFIVPQAFAQPSQMGHFGDSCQFIFFLVYEGLYEDGATQEGVNRVLMKREGFGYEQFIGHCPICMSVKLAVQNYANRPRFEGYKQVGYKGQNSTFGSGFSDEIKMGLASKDVKV